MGVAVDVPLGGGLATGAGVGDAPARADADGCGAAEGSGDPDEFGIGEATDDANGVGRIPSIFPGGTLVAVLHATKGTTQEHSARARSERMLNLVRSTYGDVVELSEVRANAIKVVE